MRRSAYLCVGPSLSPRQLKQLPADITILPPVASGDLLRLQTKPGDVIGIVDGYFHHVPAIRHKEVMFLLQQNIDVFGAASMGALRAAELQHFGMQGYGQIYKDYCHGVIEGDDEVAVLHAVADEGYKPLTEALINIRHNLERALQGNICSQTTKDAVLAIACQLPYIDRTYPRILSQANERGVDKKSIDRLSRFLIEQSEDLKQRDALLLIDALKDSLVHGTSGRRRLLSDVKHTTYLQRWRESAEGNEHQLAGFISNTKALTLCQLYAADYPGFHYETVLASIAAGSEESLILSDCDGGADNLDQLRAVVLEHARATGIISSIESINDGSLPLEQWLAGDELSLPPTEKFARLAVRSFCISPRMAWRGALVEALKRNGKLNAAIEGVAAVQLFNHELKRIHPNYRADIVKRDRVIEWFKQRWRVGGNFELALLDRGFAGVNQFVKQAQPFYLFDKYDDSHRLFAVAGRLC